MLSISGTLTMDDPHFRCGQFNEPYIEALKGVVFAFLCPGRVVGTACIDFPAYVLAADRDWP
jgi:hypothetical protein